MLESNLAAQRNRVWVCAHFGTLLRLDQQIVCDRSASVNMLTSRQLYVLLMGIGLASQFRNVAAQAPAPAPGIQLESDEAAAAADPISTQQQQPLTESASLPVTCNITLVGKPANPEPAVAVAGRRLHAPTKTGGGLSMADIHCTGSYTVTIVGGPALQPFASSWTGELVSKNALCS